MSFAEKKPFVWQRECLNRWLSNHGRGTVRVVTGAGKTYLAVQSIAALAKSPLLAPGMPLRVKIVVPKTFLVHQWANVLKTELRLTGQRIGYYYGGHKNRSERDIMIYVVNSARYALSRHIMGDLRDGYSVLLIADECHHYGSEENARIFDFIPLLGAAATRFFSLGLSATPETFDRGLEQNLGREIFEYGFTEALNAKIISDFSIFRVGVDFSTDELADYTEFTTIITRCLSRLKGICPALRHADSASFFALLQRLTSDRNQSTASLAQSALANLYKRRETVYLAEARIPCVVELIGRLRADARIIVFGERIEAADRLYRQLARDFPGQVGHYHSQLSPEEKRLALGRYQNSEIRILVSCKALDEGLNVPQTDVGIILSETASARQRIQRLGRILRRSDENRTACLYALFVRQAAEEPDRLGDLDASELTYNSARREFSSLPYDSLCSKVLAQQLSRGTPEKLLCELRQNMRLGIVRSDFLLPEPDCQARADAATGAEKNYWITMLLLSRARNEKTKPQPQI